MNDMTKNSIIYFLHRSTFFLIIFPLILSYKTSSILLISTSLIFTYILIKLVIYFKKYKLFNYIINIILVLFIIYMFYLLVDFIHIEYLINTNYLYIYLLFFLTTFFISSKKFETISKASFILFIISLLLFLIQSITLVSDINYIYKIHKINIISLLLDSIKISLISTIPFFIINDTKKIRNYYLISSLTILITSIFTINIINNNLLHTYKYPLYQLFSHINIFGFINRLESLFSLMWITDVIICLSLCIHYIKNKVHIKHMHHK